MKISKVFKQFLTVLVMVSILAISTIPSYAYSNNAYSINENYYISNNDALNSSIEEMVDNEGNIISVETEKLYDSNEIQVKVYVNNKLTQISLVDGDMIYYKDVTKISNNINGDAFDVTDYDKVYNFNENISIENDLKDISPENEVSYKSYSDGWAFYRNYEPITWYYGTKPCDLYFINYDEEPDQHKFNAKTVSITVGTPVSVAIGLIVGYATSNLTPLGILSIIGCSIVGDVITNYVSSELTYSTQRIRYRPMINGREIFGDAYIDKLWLINHDNLTDRYSFHLANNVYRANRGTSPDEIARNAQIAEVQGQY